MALPGTDGVGQQAEVRIIGARQSVRQQILLGLGKQCPAKGLAVGSSSHSRTMAEAAAMSWPSRSVTGWPFKPCILSFPPTTGSYPLLRLGICPCSHYPRSEPVPQPRNRKTGVLKLTDEGKVITPVD